MKVRLGKTMIYKDRDIEIPDDAYDFAFTAIGPDTAEITFLVPSNPDANLKAKVTEIMHHLHGEYR